MTKKNDIWYQHEGLDRASMILSHLHSAFGDVDDPHPSIYNEECNKLLAKCYKNLSKLYQEISQWEKEND